MTDPPGVASRAVGGVVAEAEQAVAVVGLWSGVQVECGPFDDTTAWWVASGRR